MSSLIGIPSADSQQPAAAGGTAAAGDLIKDTDMQSFNADVIEASMEVPIIVDFWATWCGPCKQLGPLLEKTVTTARGAVRMVKIDIDKNQALAAQLRIQSVPTVYAFFKGQPLDGFQGALPESQIKAFIDRVIEASGAAPGGDNIKAALEQAQMLEQEESFPEASSLYAQILQVDPENKIALSGLLRMQIRLGKIEAAQTTFDSLPDELKAAKEMDAVRAALELAAVPTADHSETTALKSALEANPDDHESRFSLAQLYYSEGKLEAAAGELLEIIKQDRSWNEDAARTQLLKYFEAWGPTDPLTLKMRRRLSSLLFA